MKQYFSHILLGLLFAPGCILAYKQNPVPISKDVKTKRIENNSIPSYFTPKGVSVDTHGRALDTDGDGIPDYKDKELLTHRSCFPVDRNGFGVCPQPLCCTEYNHDILYSFPDCTVSNAQIYFTPKRKELTKAATTTLKKVAMRLKSNPSCNLRAGTYGGETKTANKLSWDRVNAVIDYLIEKENIAEDRLAFSYDIGDINMVEIIIGEDNEPNSTPSPHPYKKTSTRRN